MNILNNKLTDNLSKHEIECLQEKEKEYKLIGHQRKIPGHILFSYNFKTKEIKKADVKHEITIDVSSNIIKKQHIKIEPDCYYEQALNIKNFIKRLKRKGYYEK